jgi:hypothetical protein
MSSRPLDTSPQAWSTYAAVLGRMSGEARLSAALEFSDSIREIQLAGIQARHPTWDAARVIRHLIADEYGVQVVGGR